MVGGDHKDRPPSPHAALSISLCSFLPALLCCSRPLAALWNSPPVLFLMPTVSSTKQPLRGACWKKVAISYEDADPPPPPTRCRQTHSRVGTGASLLGRLLPLQTASRFEIKGKWIETTLVLPLQCNFQSNKHSGFQRKREIEPFKRWKEQQQQQEKNSFALWKKKLEEAFGYDTIYLMCFCFTVYYYVYMHMYCNGKIRHSYCCAFCHYGSCKGLKNILTSDWISWICIWTMWTGLFIAAFSAESLIGHVQ